MRFEKVKNIIFLFRKQNFEAKNSVFNYKHCFVFFVCFFITNYMYIMYTNILFSYSNSFKTLASLLPNGQESGKARHKLVPWGNYWWIIYVYIEGFIFMFYFSIFSSYLKKNGLFIHVYSPFHNFLIFLCLIEP